MTTERNSFSKPASYPTRWVVAGRAWFGLRAACRRLRISRPMTRALGPHYQRSRERIEIDITYLCNLHCLNCNRSVRQAPESLHMPLEMTRRFVDESMARRKPWKRIRVLGGEADVGGRLPVDGAGPWPLQVERQLVVINHEGCWTPAMRASPWYWLHWLGPHDQISTPWLSH